MKILDTTIRDGSYAIDFKFSCCDVEEIVGRMESVGIEYIEIGHGQGLNASSPEHGIALHSDIEYMMTARKTLKKAKFGFFCIPGIARLEDLHIAKTHGVSFVRIGVNAEQLETAEAYIKEAKKLNLITMVNFMKSYTILPNQIADKVKQVEVWGADVVYIVDSAGYMLPEELGEYYDAIREKSDVTLGFHGHNNLGLAVANSLYCVEKGFEFIDCSLQGLGRSIGNASTEMFVMALKRKGYKFDMDIPRLLEYGYVLLKDVVQTNLQSPLDLICGYAGFHSGFLKEIYRCSNEKKVDPLRLIIAYSELDKKTMDYEKLCEVAEQLPEDDDRHPYNFRNFFTSAYNDK